MFMLQSFFMGKVRKSTWHQTVIPSTRHDHNMIGGMLACSRITIRFKRCAWHMAINLPFRFRYSHRYTHTHTHVRACVSNVQPTFHFPCHMKYPHPHSLSLSLSLALSAVLPVLFSQLLFFHCNFCPLLRPQPIIEDM